jgi:hypothetical protein
MQVPYRAAGSAGFRGMRAPGAANFRTPYSGNRFVASRPGDRSMGASAARVSGRGSEWDRNRDRWDARRRSFNNWYTSIYPGWLIGYPYLLDPGFYDWGDNDDAAYGQGDEAPYQDYGYEPPAGDYAGPGEPAQQELPPWPGPGRPLAAMEPAASPAPEQPLTVYFKGGRSPLTMQNYMMTGKTLTDLDSGHFARIPIDQIDVAETQRVNGAAGLQFQVPAAPRN